MATSEAQSPIVIRDITTIAEMHEVEQLQKQVWGVADLEVLPALALVPMTEVGGVLVGAFDGERMVGFAFGFPGNEKGRPILHSDMLAVNPEYREHGLGYKLKLAQRERALANGIDTITWTFDPLQSLNAHLNISKLGVVSNSYRSNYYGETTSFLHRTGTDRLWVTWSLNSDRVRQRIEARQSSLFSDFADGICLVRVGDDSEPLTLNINLRTQPLVIEIPGSINNLFREKPQLVHSWREATRNAFIRTFAGGYGVAEFFREQRNGTEIGRYLLRSGNG
jgi:predicted GNAT superfamily acetyltransferase